MRLIETGMFKGLPAHNARCLYADPAWKDVGYTADPGIKAPPYKTMTLEQIKAMPVIDLCWKECWLFLWTSGPFLDHARQVMKAWGFRYSTIAFTWVKLRKTFDVEQPHALLPVGRQPNDFHRGLGRTTRKNTELCLLGKLGSPRIRQGGADELIISPVREHSRKPEIHDRIEALVDGPYVELNARRSERASWTFWGDEMEKFNDTQDHQPGSG